MSVDLAFDDRGTGTPVVLLHAFPTARTLWRDVAVQLAADARIITPDLRGFGESALGNDEPDLDLVADDIVALLDRLDVPKFVVGGVSLGGYLTMNLLRRHSDRVAGAIFVDTKAAADTDDARARRIVMADAVVAADSTDAYVDGWRDSLLGPTSRSWRPQAVTQLEQWARVTAPATISYYQRAMAARPDSFDVLADTQVPTIVIVGAEDEVTPPSDAEAMRAVLKHCTLEIIAGAGHLSPLEAPDEVATAMRGFVSSFGQAC